MTCAPVLGTLPAPAAPVRSALRTRGGRTVGESRQPIVRGRGFHAAAIACLRALRHDGLAGQGRRGAITGVLVTAGAVAGEDTATPTPPLVFTIAVTGHRDIAAAPAAALETAIRELLATIATRLREAMAASPVDQGRALHLRFVSALAPGADQIGFRAASHKDSRAHGWSCSAILPFARADYVATIASDTAIDPDVARQGAEAMAALAGRAAGVLELADWSPRGASEYDAQWVTRRYATLGAMLVRQADLLVALWNGKPPKGTGGTADVVREARASGVPVLWLDPDRVAAGQAQVVGIVPQAATSHAPLLDLAAGWAAGDLGGRAYPDLATPDEAIDRAIANVLLGQPPARGEAVNNYLTREPFPRWQRSDGGEPAGGTQAALYSLVLWLVLLGSGQRSWPFARGARRADGRRWWLPPVLAQLADYSFSAKFRIMAQDQLQRAGTVTANDAAIERFARRADAIATRLGDHYRSLYLAIFILAAAAVAFALAYVFNEAAKPFFVTAEVLTVSLAALFFWRASPRGLRLGGWQVLRGRDTHRRWMDARLVAESQRGAQMLAWIGLAGRRAVEQEETAGAVGGHSADGHGQGHGHGHGAARTVWAPHFANAVSA